MSRPSSLLSKSRYPRWSFVFAGTGALVLIVGISSARETYQGWRVDKEIEGLRAQVATLEGKRLHLAETLGRLQTPDAVDKEARLRLGLQKPGERVFILQEDGLRASHATRDGSLQTEDAVSNPQKWLRYFFHPTTDGQ